MPSIPASSVGRGLSIPLTSQIVTGIASPQFHRLNVARIHETIQNVGMPDSDKNGGPNYLRAWREYHRMTQQQLADAVGTNANMIGYLEEGERGLSLKWLRRLAPALKTRPIFLAEIDPQKADTRTMELAAAIPDEKREQVNMILETFLKNGTGG
jgi:transcriptional regulator with XRE-family HTH domain